MRSRSNDPFATPIEQQMSGVKDMLYMESVNANDGTLTLRVHLDVDSSIDIDQVNTQNKVAQAQPQLPTDVTNFGLTFQQTAGLPLLVLDLYSAEGDLRSALPGQLRDHQRDGRALSRSRGRAGPGLRDGRLRDGASGSSRTSWRSSGSPFPIWRTRSRRRTTSIRPDAISL